MLPIMGHPPMPMPGMSISIVPCWPEPIMPPIMGHPPMPMPEPIVPCWGAWIMPAYSSACPPVACLAWLLIRPAMVCPVIRGWGRLWLGTARQHGGGDCHAA